MNENIPREFNKRLDAARLSVADARVEGDNVELAKALKELGNVERRHPNSRRDANQTFEEAADIYDGLGMSLEAAWVLRHIGINHEHCDRLTEAEKYYDQSLALFRQHASENDSNYANTVRYPAVIKNLLGKREEATTLWEEAVKRYEEIGEQLGVAEGAAWLAIFAVEKGDAGLASEWLSKAEAAAAAAKDKVTDEWITEVKLRLLAA